jgi:hypothetical protein
MCTTPVTRRMFPRLRESRFRGDSTFKPARASLSPEDSFRIITKGPTFKPEELIGALRTLGQVSSPSLTAVSVLCQRAAAAAEQFYPPQIVEVFSGLAKIGHTDSEPLMSLLTERLGDVLNEASPRRIVLLIVAMADLELHLFSTEIWPPFRKEIARLLPQFKRGIPSLLQSLAKLGCKDLELANALLVQAECLYTTAEIEREFFVHAIEAASRIDGMSESVVRAMNVLNHDMSAGQKINVLAAHLRAGKSGQEIIREVQPHIRGEGNGFNSARLLGMMGRLGITLQSENSPVIELLEKKFADEEFMHKFGGYLMLNAALVSDSGLDNFLRLALDKAVSDRLAADKLLALLRAARIVKADPSVEEKILNSLAVTARQLSVREGRYLWEITPGLVPTSALPLTDPFGNHLQGLENCPYRLREKSAGELELLVPRYQAVSACGKTVRREVALRLEAVRRCVPRDAQLVLNHSY